jgi:hypothetical protein
MADRNIETVEKTLLEMQETLRLMREALKAPKQYNYDDIPLK